MGHLARAHLELARGRVRGALAQLREAEPFAPAWVREVRATFALALRQPIDVAAPGNALEELESWDAAGEPPSRGALLWVHDASMSQLAIGCAGTWPCEWETSPVQGGTQRYSRVSMLTASSRAWRCRMRPECVPPSPIRVVRWKTRCACSTVRAHASRRISPWFGAIVERSVFDLIHLGPSHIARSEILRELDEREAALAHDAALLRMWGDCDEELRPLVDAAAARLRRGGRAITA